MRGFERVDAAAARRELLEIREPAFVDPALDQPRVHAVESEDDQLLAEFLRRAARLAGRSRGDTNDKQPNKRSFHSKCKEPGIITFDYARPWRRRRRAAGRSRDQRPFAHARAAADDV